MQSSSLIRLQSKRIFLVPLPLTYLELLRTNRQLMEEALGLIPSGLMLEAEIEVEVEEAIQFWLVNVKEHPESWCWYTNWEIIHRTDNRSIGGIGLAGKPDINGMVEVGYGLDQRFRNQGYMTEALGLFLKWIFIHPQAYGVRAQTPKNNRSSQVVLEKNGFSSHESSTELLIWELLRNQYEKR